MYEVIWVRLRKYRADKIWFYSLHIQLRRNVSLTVIIYKCYTLSHYG